MIKSLSLSSPRHDGKRNIEWRNESLKHKNMQVIQMKLYLGLNHDRVSRKAISVLTNSLDELNDLNKELLKMNFKNRSTRESLSIYKKSL